MYITRVQQSAILHRNCRCYAILQKTNKLEWFVLENAKSLPHLWRRSVSVSRTELLELGLGCLDGEPGGEMGILREKRGDAGIEGDAQQGLGVLLKDKDGLLGGEQLAVISHLFFSSSNYCQKVHFRGH